MKRFVRFFNEMTKRDSQEAGGKAANLGELEQNGFNVPSGFCVTSGSLSYVIDQNDLEPKIDAIVHSFDYNDYEGMEEKTSEIRDLISSAQIPDELYQEISQSIKDLCQTDEPFVAVRSSVAVKDSPISSFPGMMDTYHYLKGEEEIVRHVRMCWASLWTVRAAINRFHKGIDHHLGLIAPIIQKMIHSDVAGVLFTANPITSVRDEMVIEANWGLGESVVSGKSMNDFYVISKSPLILKDKKISRKTLMVSFDEQRGFGRKETSVTLDKMDAPTLSDRQVLDLGKIGLRIEALFAYPQDIEWAYEGEELFVLQSRNIRTLKG
jgi:phosphoenolpyruvate synthase/pyruvate phosphate dikinase